MLWKTSYKIGEREREREREKKIVPAVQWTILNEPCHGGSRDRKSWHGCAKLLKACGDGVLPLPLLTGFYYLNACWAPHQLILKLSQWQLCSAVLNFRADPLHSSCDCVCDSEWVTVALIQHAFQYSLKWCVWLLHGWCHVKLLPSRRVHQITMSLHLKAHT